MSKKHRLNRGVDEGQDARPVEADDEDEDDQRHEDAEFAQVEIADALDRTARRAEDDALEHPEHVGRGKQDADGRDDRRIRPRESDCQAPSRLRNSPGKPARPGSPSEANDANASMPPATGTAFESPEMSAIMRVCVRS